MHHLNIDIETRSKTDISTAGSYKYAQDPDFSILLFAYKYDSQQVQVIDLACGERIPEHILQALKDPDVTKHAYNAAFEWYCLNRAGYDTPLEQWQCTMIQAAYFGYPMGLESTGNAMGLPEDKKKLSIGRTLIRYFCVPGKNGRFHDPEDDTERWKLFKTYNAQDVEAEHSIWTRLSLFPGVPEREWELWRLDVEMNACGVHIDRALVEGAILLDQQADAELKQEALDLTALANPNSTAQLLPWLNQRLPEPLADVRKETLKELLDKDIPTDVRRVLELRLGLSKTSVKKYITMLNMACTDDRIRGISQFYGAHTGRYCGRGVQLQNMSKHHISDVQLDLARSLVSRRDYTGAKLIFGDVKDLLSQLTRTALTASDGRHFVVADFSAIEARVIAWLAGEAWVNEVFATHGKIYEATASQMFGVPMSAIKKGNPEYALRQKGKVATLALGYQGGTGSLISMGALKMGISEEELPEIVQKWRKANPNIVGLWYAVERAAIDTVQKARPNMVMPNKRAGVYFGMEAELIYGQSFLTVVLPSGRKIYYPKPFIAAGTFDNPAVHFYSAGQAKKWKPEATYGGKLTENIVQAIARDCLCEILLRLKRAGLQVVFHVHDEVIVDAPVSVTSEQLCELMAEPIEWAPGLILKGAGFEREYYIKD